MFKVTQKLPQINELEKFRQTVACMQCFSLIIIKTVGYYCLLLCTRACPIVHCKMGDNIIKLYAWAKGGMHISAEWMIISQL